MAEEKKEAEKKNKSTKRSRNNPNAKSSTTTRKRSTSSTKSTDKVKKENKKATPKNEVKAEPNLDKIKEELRKEIVNDVVKDIKKETKDTLNEVKEVSKEQQKVVKDIKNEINDASKEQKKEVEALKEEVKEVTKKQEEDINGLKDEIKDNASLVTEGVVAVTNPVDAKVEEIKEKPLEQAQPTIEFENSYPQSFFDGGVLGLIGWRLLGLLLTVCSLGLLAPLASIFLLKWQYKHTVINGRRVTFDGNYFQLLGKMICWILLSVITLGIYLFFIPVAWNKWVIKHVHYVGGEVNPEKQSTFTGNTLQFIGVILVCILLTVFSLGILYPCAYCYAMSWRIKHTIIDGDELEFDGHALGYFGLCLKWVFFTIITLGIYSFWIPVNALKWEIKHTNKRGLSKKTYNPVLAVIIPLIIAIIIFVLGIVFVVMPNSLLDYFKNDKDKTEEVEETETGSEWGDKYYKYLKKKGYDNGEYKGAFIDLDKDKTPELVLDKEIIYCVNCDSNTNQIVILTIEDNKVEESDSYDSSKLTNLYDMNEEEQDWYIVENEKTYTKADTVFEEEKDTFRVDTKEEEKEFNDQYIDTEANVNYRELEEKELKKDVSSLVDDYNDNKNYDGLDDNQIDTKVEEYKKEQELLKNSTLTKDNYKDKIDDNIKWFIGAYLGEEYGWIKVYQYKQVNITIPGVPKEAMIYELVGATSINGIKQELAKYVDESRFNQFSRLCYDFKEYNGKVYWPNMGIGDGPYLKDYSLISSSDGVSKVRLNIYEGLGNYLIQYVEVTIEYQASSNSYLITDWDVHNV